MRGVRGSPAAPFSGSCVIDSCVIASTQLELSRTEGSAFGSSLPIPMSGICQRLFAFGERKARQ